MRIIITERIADEGINYLKENGFEVDTRYGISSDELLGIIGDYDAIIVRSVTKVNEELLEAAKNLKVVGRAGNGIDNIDVGACTKRGIIVVNTPESNIMAAAELAVALAFAIFRNLPQVHVAVRNKDFRRNRFIGNELDGKTAGIIGLGRIGSIVARKLKGCNMRVVAYDPYITDDRFKMLGVEKCETLEELLKQSDLITLHTPKTSETYGMIGEKELNMCKRGVRIVNAARGGLVNEKALYDALKDGRVTAAALDVLDPEPSYDKKPEEQDYTNPLLELDNVMVTPHLGASTQEANYNVGTAITELVAGALKGEMVAAVNMPPMHTKDLSELRPYLNLAEMLGKIYYQAEKETVQQIEVIYRGDLADKETKVISLSVLKGFLDPINKEKVNYVNAELMLKNMGVEFKESKSTNLDKYTNLITVKFTTKKKELSVSGTVFAKEEIRIVDFFGYKLDFEPTPYVLAIQNVDKPGIIGQIGTILGADNINIAAMQWSRNRRGEKAVAFVSVDAEVSEEIMRLLKNIDGVLKVSMLKF
ncbi:phosphoglycerate dehydrogenase [Clostridium thermosuccinogenes]|jgi:D-3-phosphoglycerate dehydrogenase|uniref:D-3-phosphoglycerate dehydrogenase n=1 Tax=Clostridium thermosuccinogenes TaxID=84032 RepID=A0A2K2FFL2_9CLOT|nr:phosphoglycerate dehydrogenase [Pseudoclostridium thermosuccinogenes]AUS96642.1 phosphoglycerate dehydrogenase [Pseudoclostridium thermosuccinogenes]PNT92698.1 phosphoglycerate dehydrogenase [Pseudoclostridium thermosuccinogenes]PNT97558.1 phosphoglycerate dehydrogenase [Pseudoclostridium thermosuccinogenes]PNT99554.1 phosphoglycerate dehydrogenase [Pseudoclostridium thermosuccinogenes]